MRLGGVVLSLFNESQVHQAVGTATSIATDPLSHNALTLAHTVSYDVEGCPSPEAQELFDLLTSPHVDVSTLVY